MGVFVPVVTTVSSSVVVVVVLSSDFAQPMITKLIIARKISKFVEFFIGTSLINNNSYKYTDPAGPDQILKFPFIPN